MYFTDTICTSRELQMQQRHVPQLQTHIVWFNSGLDTLSISETNGSSTAPAAFCWLSTHSLLWNAVSNITRHPGEQIHSKVITPDHGIISLNLLQIKDAHLALHDFNRCCQRPLPTNCWVILSILMIVFICC